MRDPRLQLHESPPTQDDTGRHLSRVWTELRTWAEKLLGLTAQRWEPRVVEQATDTVWAQPYDWIRYGTGVTTLALPDPESCPGATVVLEPTGTVGTVRSTHSEAIAGAATGEAYGEYVAFRRTGTATWWWIRRGPVPGIDLTDSAPANVTKAAAAVGTGTTAARSDHKHDVATAAASSLTGASTSTEGTATSLARSDHTHSIVGLLSDTAPANVTKSAAAAGTATAGARQDHKHDVTTAAASALAVGGSNAEGTATSLARSDHTHGIGTGAPTAMALGCAASNGTAWDAPRLDHVHALSAIWTDPGRTSGVVAKQGPLSGAQARTTDTSGTLHFIVDVQAITGTLSGITQPGVLSVVWTLSCIDQTTSKGIGWARHTSVVKTEVAVPPVLGLIGNTAAEIEGDGPATFYTAIDDTDLGSVDVYAGYTMTGTPTIDWVLTAQATFTSGRTD